MGVGKVVGGVAVGIVAIGVLANNGDDKKKSETVSASSPSYSSYTSAPSKAAVAAPAIAPAGSSVRDGKFEFTVVGTKRAATKEGTFSSKQAKGEFYTVTLKVTNTGNDARSMAASNQHLLINGNKYDADTSISDASWMEDINPGLGMTADVTFDIPPGAQPEAIEVHDSMFSGGAKLAL